MLSNNLIKTILVMSILATLSLINDSNYIGFLLYTAIVLISIFHKLYRNSGK